jgi:hypothetical protein
MRLRLVPVHVDHVLVSPRAVVKCTLAAGVLALERHRAGARRPSAYASAADKRRATDCSEWWRRSDAFCVKSLPHSRHSQRLMSRCVVSTCRFVACFRLSNPHSPPPGSAHVQRVCRSLPVTCARHSSSSAVGVELTSSLSVGGARAYGCGVPRRTATGEVERLGSVGRLRSDQLGDGWGEGDAESDPTLQGNVSPMCYHNEHKTRTRATEWVRCYAVGIAPDRTRV